MIKKYLDEKSGKELWEVYVNVRSLESQFRTQKRVKAIKTEELARKAELQLTRDCERLLAKAANSGVIWDLLLEKYEFHLRDNFSLKISKITRNDYIGSIRKHSQQWMKKEADSISSLDVLEFFRVLPAEMSLKQKQNLKMILSKVFRFGIDSGLLKRTKEIPTVGITFEKDEDIKQEILTLTEIKKLLLSAKLIDHPWYPVWAVALLTGMRNGELVALTWDDIDFENKLLTVSKSYNRRLRITKSTKSGYWRSIPISPDLEILLKELKLKCNGVKFVLPRFREWDKGYQAERLRQFCIGTGLPSIKFHTLRACFATQLIRQGVPPIQIQKICGWKDLETMQRYIRLAGIEVTGVTDNLKIIPETEIMGKVVSLFRD